MKQDDWMLGFAAALATVKRQHGLDVEVRDALIGNGITLQALLDAGVESYDARTILEAIRHDAPTEEAARGSTVRNLERRIRRRA